MGKIILCSGVLAERPFHFDLTDTDIYSIEELCYYLYHNIYSITEECFQDSMVEWLREELKMEDISSKLKAMIENQNELKDIVVSILCSADYYTETEIKELIKIMDQLYHCSPTQKIKIKADNYLNYKKYLLAVKEYERLLKHEQIVELTTEEYGNILHNLGVAYVHTSSFIEAAGKFKEAFSRNHNPETLKQYLFALKLAKCDNEYKNERTDLGITEEQEDAFISELEEVLKEAENTTLYQTIENLPTVKQNGRVGDYYQKIDELIANWKQEYKKEVG
jgi:hypothetical protein